MQGTGVPQLTQLVLGYMSTAPYFDGTQPCASMDPEIFFPEDKQGRASREDHWEIAFAKGICQDCPIRNLCLEYALTADEEFGIWGGFTTSERRALLKKKR